MAIGYPGAAANRHTYAGAILTGYPCTVIAKARLNTLTGEHTVFRNGSTTGGAQDCMFALESNADGFWVIVGQDSSYSTSAVTGLSTGVWYDVMARITSDTYRDVAVGSSFSTPETTSRNIFLRSHAFSSIAAYTGDGATFGNAFDGDLAELLVIQATITNDEWLDYIAGGKSVGRLRTGAIRLYLPLTSTGTQTNLATNKSFVFTQSGSPTTVTHPSVTAFVNDGSLAVCLGNQRYVTVDGTTPIYLSGMGTWPGIVDYSPTSFAAISATDYTSYLNVMQAKGCNLTRIFVFDVFRNTGLFNANDFFAPGPFARTGPGNALDGGLKWDLTTFDAAYFTRMQAFLQAALDRGIYVQIMLHEALNNRTPATTWRKDGHPGAAANNINGIDADANVNGSVEEWYTRSIAAINTVQEAYWRKVIDTVHTYPNVVIEIANEANLTTDTYTWQAAAADALRAYQRTRPATYKHLIARTPGSDTGADQSIVLRDGGDLVQPSGAWTGFSNAPTPTLPSIDTVDTALVFDSDHFNAGSIAKDDFWRAFTRGYNVHLMEDYYAIGTGVISGVATIRDNLGYILRYANRLDLLTAIPNGALSSTGYCLGTAGSQYLVYQTGSAAFTVNLSANGSTYNTVEWLNTNNGATLRGSPIVGGSAAQSVTPPFSGSPSGIMLLLKLAAPSPDAILTGTASDGMSENDIRVGGKTLILTISADTFIPS